jgi:LysM repeat protein
MNKLPSVILLFLFFSSFSLTAGSFDSIGVTKINDKLHIRYMVSPGETIYGISTKYGISVADLMELNPELENGLKVGQIINIPYNPEMAKKEKKDENVIIHKVQPGETFYGLAKKYNTTVSDLMKMNNMELKAGQELIVGYKNQVKPDSTSVAEKPNTENANKENSQNNNANSTEVKNNPKPAESYERYPYDPSRKQVLIIPFDPYLYFSDADDEIAAKSNMPRTKVRQVFRKRLNALLEAPGYETIHLLGGKAKDSLSDLNKVYSMVTYNYQPVVLSPYYKETTAEPKPDPKKDKNKSWIEKQKQKLINDPGDSKYDIPKDHGSYFGVVIKSPEFFTYFNDKYGVDYYVFISQFEVKTNYEHCLDRAAQNYDRTFTTHYSIFDSTGKQIAGGKFKTHYNSNTNYIYTIVSDNVEKIANRIIADLPPPGGN